MPRGRFRVLYLRPPDLDLDAFPRRIGILASQVAHAYDLRGSSHIEELKSAGHTRALQLAREFRPSYPEGYRQPDNAFWGWAYREVLTEIQREAARIRAGGTIRSPRRTKNSPSVIARPISDYYDEAKGNDFSEAIPGLHIQPDGVEDDDCHQDPTAAKKSLRSVGDKLLEAGARFGEFISAVERVAGVDFPMSASVETDGGSIRYTFSDGRNSHFFRLFKDGTMEHRSSALPVGSADACTTAAERN